MLVVRYDNGTDMVEQPFMKTERGLAEGMAQKHAQRHMRATLVEWGTDGARIVRVFTKNGARRAA